MADEAEKIAVVAEENKDIDIDKMDLSRFAPPEKVEQLRSKLVSFAQSGYQAERERHVAPEGTFNLPPLIEARRLKWKIPDGVFRVAGGTGFDRILLWQIPLLSECLEDEDFIGGAGGVLVKSAQTREKETREAPRGVIVGAGLRALDELRANGYDLGQIVYFAKNTVYSIQVDYIAGKWERVSLARSGDLITSEDLALNVRTNAVEIRAVERMGEDGVMRTEHLLVDGKGVAHERLLPPAEDDL